MERVSRVEDIVEKVGRGGRGRGRGREEASEGGKRANEGDLI